MKRSVTYIPLLVAAASVAFSIALQRRAAANESAVLKKGIT